MTTFSRIVHIAIAISITSVSLASPTDTHVQWDVDSRLPIRSGIQTPGAMLTPVEGGIVNDSVGIPLGASPENVRDGLRQLVEQKGAAALDGSTLYVTGIAMGREKETEARYQDILKEAGLQVRVKVLSIPKEKIRLATLQGWKALLQRLRYFFPSLTRDYQKPTSDEVTSGLISAAMIDTPNLVFLYHTMPTLDATVVISTHLAILTLYAVYKKFMINWILRPGTNHVELFMKQLGFAVPFVANFAIFGHLSEILNFYKFHGWAATASQFPRELATFGATQGLTIVLQTLFYNMIINEGVRGWENRQAGRASERARVVANYITVPILAVDGVLLASAAIAQNAVFSVGPLHVTLAHMALLGVALAGKGLFWIAPEFLNPTLRWDAGLRNLKRKFGDGSRARRCSSLFL